MRYRVTFLAGFASGYVLGAKAGRQRYESITSTARNFMEKPAVQETAGLLQAQVSDLAGSAKRVVTDKVGGRSGGSFEDGYGTNRPYGTQSTTNPGGTGTTNGGAARH